MEKRFHLCTRSYDLRRRDAMFAPMLQLLTLLPGLSGRMIRRYFKKRYL